MNFLEMYWSDVYKTGHKPMLPQGSLLMSSNLTPRSGKHANFKGATGVISIGQQVTVRQMAEDWKNNFFDRPVEEIFQFGKDIEMMCMLENYDVSHIIELHTLGYLPLEIRAVQEGAFIPYKVPMLSITNTAPLNGTIADWLVNYIETILSAESWQAPTSATLALEYYKLGMEYAKMTDPENTWFVDYQFHDFSARGLAGKSGMIKSGLGFASVSRGSDTLVCIPAARKYYDEPFDEVIINSVIASEHAIMCSLTGFFIHNKKGSWDKVGDMEVETFRYLLQKFPKGILSLVSDTWDLWRVITEYCVILKDEILARDGKLVIRPDSGDPADILCGYYEIPVGPILDNYNEAEIDHAKKGKGVIELLWDIFGGTVTSTGYKKLDSHIGAIYGDSITIDRAKDIFERLKKKGFASTNVVLGVGSYSLQYVTRDTHGFAQKATYIEVLGTEKETIGIEIFKDPITDDGMKKSAKGLLAVHDVEGVLTLKDQCTWEEVKSENNQMKVIFRDGQFYNQTTFKEIRERVKRIL